MPFLPSYQQQSITIHGLKITKLLDYGGLLFFLKGPNHKHLTSADPLRSDGAGAEIAFQPLGVVAGLRFAAIFIELLSADLTATAAIQNQPDSRGALGHLQGAVAGGRAGGESLEQGKEKTRVSFGVAEERSNAGTKG